MYRNLRNFRSRTPGFESTRSRAFDVNVDLDRSDTDPSDEEGVEAVLTRRAYDIAHPPNRERNLGRVDSHPQTLDGHKRLRRYAFALHVPRQVRRFYDAVVRRQNREYKYYSCFRGEIGRRIDLRRLHNMWLTSKLRNRDPIMLTYTLDRNCTLIVFATGKFRFMGPFAPDAQTARQWLHAIHPRYQVLPDVMRAPLQLQTCTVVFQLPHAVNLYRLVQILRRDRRNVFEFDPERFPAITLTGFAPYHVKIFYSGQVTVTGFDADTP
jgi:TATA-box binding protein (TBP) (component of TFIID and TFIIIB)